jgi:DNA-binding MarR family transcriptional regulator
MHDHRHDTERKLSAGQDRIGDEVDSASLARLADAVLSLADDIHAASIPTWQPLTGLQVLFVTTIARGGRITRPDLTRDCRTSRAAITPGLASLLNQGFIVEIQDGPDLLLTLGPAGRDLIAKVDRARVEWVRRALLTQGEADADHVHRLTSALQQLRPPKKSRD